ncbi:hydrogenase expression/formation protein HypE [endosymbiont of Ridgeia piscesae]|jgi:hydrogenase expression/formation protein HypE|uniref:Hydrogenase maturation protein, carbamoyl dehydratase HypE n=1 Tax=endosymbiont of Ridgeia piscesae TaxID=54398 RepID=A0A0T5Z0B2_9GAMM|nr:hydrogenase expression/formation protein HypE [endosymbiont of Ridgeia piscesae]KRT55918.1 Hydrogenase maturation protein, carbamoyl dehydratase HypE [endosymbiont of Ridgeia piscesae]KRT58349.1 Hydrogenase maturation protein, carbamoyl dehydratase HypE [endosymbiont of Ridgeia piscesae]
MQDKQISLAHGNGGRFMRELIEEIFARHLANPELDVHADAVALPLERDGDLLFTTDGFTVQPLEFPGGNIGSLAVHGTCNDLAVAGALPRYLSLNAFIEEGFEIEQLERIVRSIAAAANAIDVRIAAGDTKVVRRGEGGGIYLATTGVGLRPAGVRPALDRIQAGDRVLVSGPVGDHGIAVMLAREQFGLHGDLRSDAGSVLRLTQSLLDLPGLHFMRDPTRGGLATVAHEICRATGLQVRLNDSAIPVRDQVRSVCEILGYDPHYLACEGRVVAIVSPDQAETALERWRGFDEGCDAALIGTLLAEDAHVILQTELGGARILEELEDDPLPRIC